MDNTPQLQQDNVGNTLTNGILGKYEIHINAILREAWEKTHGIKATYWKALGLTILIFLGVVLSLVIIAFIIGAIAGRLHASQTTIDYISSILSILFVLVYILPTAPLTAGIMMIGVNHCIGEKVTAKSIFEYYAYWKQLWVYPFILLVIDSLIDVSHSYILLQLLFSLLSLYVVISYFMFPPLVVEKHLGPWKALEASRKAISHHWFKMVWFIIVLFFIVFCSLLTLGIAFIWTLPMINNAIGILYREMYGVHKSLKA